MNSIRQFFVGDLIKRQRGSAYNLQVNMIFNLNIIAMILMLLSMPILITNDQIGQLLRTSIVFSAFLSGLFSIRLANTIVIATHAMLIASFLGVVFDIFFVFQGIEVSSIFICVINILVAFHILQNKRGMLYAFLHFFIIVLFLFFDEYGIEFIKMEPDPIVLSERLFSLGLVGLVFMYLIQYFNGYFNTHTHSLRVSLKEQQNLTEKYQNLSDELRVGEAKLQAMIEHFSDPLFSYDNDCKLQAFNSSFQNFVKLIKGVDIKVGMDIRIVLPFYDDGGLFESALSRAFGGESLTLEDTVPTAYGEESFDVSVNPIWDDDGNQRGVSVLAKNVTAKVKLMKQMQEAKESAEEMNRLKTNFLANMSHEIRTPINGILGISQIIEHETNDEKMLKYVKMQKESGRRLLTTITSILHLSRLEAGSEQLKLFPINMVKLVTENIALLQSLATKKGISLNFSYAREKLDCLADEILLHQVLNNIIGNAIKFTDKGGVTVTVAQCLKAENYLQVSVEDTGIGISEEFLPKVFETFEQESSGQGRRFEGSGLGLSIAKKYVELLGGDISVKSKKGEGSSFEILLPKYIS